MTSNDEPNPYSVRAAVADSRWEVVILDEQGTVAWSRSCADETEARTFASTVQQHIYWLSADKFREYYRLPKPAA